MNDDSSKQFYWRNAKQDCKNWIDYRKKSTHRKFTWIKKSLQFSKTLLIPKDLLFAIISMASPVTRIKFLSTCQDLYKSKDQYYRKCLNDMRYLNFETNLTHLVTNIPQYLISTHGLSLFTYISTIVPYPRSIRQDEWRIHDFECFELPSGYRYYKLPKIQANSCNLVSPYCDGILMEKSGKIYEDSYVDKVLELLPFKPIHWSYIKGKTSHSYGNETYTAILCTDSLRF